MYAEFLGFLAAARLFTSDRPCEEAISALEQVFEPLESTWLSPGATAAADLPKRFVKAVQRGGDVLKQLRSLSTVRKLVTHVVLTAYDRAHGLRRFLSLGPLRIHVGDFFRQVECVVCSLVCPCDSCSRCGFWCVVVTTPFVFGQTSHMTYDEWRTQRRRIFVASKQRLGNFIRRAPNLNAGTEWFCHTCVKPAICGQEMQDITNIHQSTQQSTTRVGALMAHHPAWVSHHTGGSRSIPTVHPCSRKGEGCG